MKEDLSYVETPVEIMDSKKKDLEKQSCKPGKSQLATSWWEWSNMGIRKSDEGEVPSPFQVSMS